VLSDARQQPAHAAEELAALNAQRAETEAAA
jgi:hypothetical protein